MCMYFSDACLKLVLSDAPIMLESVWIWPFVLSSDARGLAAYDGTCRRQELATKGYSKGSQITDVLRTVTYTTIQNQTLL